MKISPKECIYLLCIIQPVILTFQQNQNLFYQTSHFQNIFPLFPFCFLYHHPSALPMHQICMEDQKISYGAFKTMALPHSLLKAITFKGYKQPTPIQRKCFPILRESRDIVAMARTGSGKTVAYIIPLLEKLKAHSLKVGCRALILVPTRELASQIGQVIKELSKFTDLRFTMLVGGNSMDEQFSSLLSNPDIIVATPGRVLHLCEEVASFSLKAVEFVVFDEADRLFEMGLSEQVGKILRLLPTTKQSCLFSATLPAELFEFARAGLNDPVLVRLDADLKISQDLDFLQFWVKPQMKEPFLLHLLQSVIPSQEKTIIFVATKHHVEYLGELLSSLSFPNLGVYGGMDQEARTNSIERFRAGKVSILIVTDVASRGIDIPLLDNVINFDFPDRPKLFVHRVGRAGRAGRQGKAYSLVTSEDLSYLVELATFLGKQLSIGPFDKGEQEDFRSCLLLGGIPEGILDSAIESIKTKMQTVSDLSLLARTAQNGYKMYAKTKAAASSDAHKRGKELIASPHSAIHPVLAANLDSNSLQQEEILAAIKRYKTTQTIFEIGKRNDAGYAAISKRKAQISPTNAASTGQNTSVIDAKTFKDSRYWLAYSSEASKMSSLDQKVYSFDAPASKSAIFDVNLDDPNALNRMQWDKRKGNFVRLRDHAQVAKRLKKNAPIESKGVFDKWKKKIGLEIPTVGQAEVSQSTLASLPKRGRDFRRKAPVKKQAKK